MSEETPRRRRPRYAGKYPRKFAEKYKEHDPGKYPDTIAKVIASGKTPAGAHRPIMVAEILEVLRPLPGGTFVDCTLGNGGHARALLQKLRPGGRLIGLDVDPIEQPKTVARMHAEGFEEPEFVVRRSNFAGLAKIVSEFGPADGVLADLGVSSMQLDDPGRGFSTKVPGPLDMRMNPGKGISAAALVERTSWERLAEIFGVNSDEPHAECLGQALAGRTFTETVPFANAVREALPDVREEEREKSVRRVFQALRIEVNEEFTALDMLLRQLPGCLAAGGRVAFLTFHSGEDRRVKKSLQAAFREGVYSRIATDVMRPSAEECHANPRATSAKLRWAVKA